MNRWELFMKGIGHCLRIKAIYAWNPATLWLYIFDSVNAGLIGCGGCIDWNCASDKTLTTLLKRLRQKVKESVRR